MKKQTPSGPVSFSCPACGSVMTFDSESQTLKCTHCGNEQPIPESNVRPVERRFDDNGGRDGEYDGEYEGEVEVEGMGDVEVRVTYGEDEASDEEDDEDGEYADDDEYAADDEYADEESDEGADDEEELADETSGQEEFVAVALERVPDRSGEQAPAPIREEFDDEASPEATDWGMAQQTIHCENCGGETIIPAYQTAAACVFCGSPKVLSQGSKASIRPETLIPFQLSKDEAIVSFKAWKKKRWFVPNAFKRGNIQSKLSGIYIPFWTFDAETLSSYSAERGDHHYRTVTRTRTVNGKRETYQARERYTVWHHVSGTYGRSFDDILIPASAHYETALLEKLGNFKLGELTGYRPEYLSGYIAERYSVDRNQGWTRAREKIDSTLHSEIRSKIGGDEIRGLSIGTSVLDRTYKHVLLPVWSAIYSYKNKQYHYMVNGQTGLVSGHAPRSAVKITFFVLFLLAVAAAALYLYVQYGGDAQSG